MKTTLIVITLISLLSACSFERQVVNSNTVVNKTTHGDTTIIDKTIMPVPFYPARLPIIIKQESDTVRKGRKVIIKNTTIFGYDGPPRITI